MFVASIVKIRTLNEDNNNNNETISTAQNKVLRCTGWHKKFSVFVQMSEPCTLRFECQLVVCSIQ